ncbi:hypothetical protein [Mesorhizobium australicum]|uniref:hypothetical protein n=1 Tax=Mesorhizobium australicum TaxID=536018 RepID=UPI003339487E
MRTDFEELSFVIPGYTPETIPLNRLIEYLQQMAVVLGDPENLHLVAIETGSVSPVLHAPKAVALEARERARRVARGDGTRKQVDAYNRIRRMVRRDARELGTPALLRSATAVLLEIPAASDDSGVLSGVRQATSVDGQLIRVGGAGDDAALQVQDLQGKILSGFTAKRGMAKDLAAHLWEPVRLHGIGLWERTGDGQWLLERMQVQSFEPIEDEDANLVLERLRSLNIAWPEDALDRLLAERQQP